MRAGGPRSDAEDVDWLCDVLDLLLAEIVKGQRQFVADVIARRSRDANRARLGQRFQPGGDVDPIAEQIGAVDDNVANMDADAQPHRLVAVAAGIVRGDRGLHRNGALHGIDRAGEISDDAVAGGVEDPAAMRGDQPIDNGSARLQTGERADFIVRHQPAVAGDVGGENRRKFSFDRSIGHARLLPPPSIAQAELS